MASRSSGEACASGTSGEASQGPTLGTLSQKLSSASGSRTHSPPRRRERPPAMRGRGDAALPA
eukprot:1158589-Alexandrium_andersonii.AAC.1